MQKKCEYKKIFIFLILLELEWSPWMQHSTAHRPFIMHVFVRPSRGTWTTSHPKLNRSNSDWCERVITVKCMMHRRGVEMCWKPQTAALRISTVLMLLFRSYIEVSDSVGRAIKLNSTYGKPGKYTTTSKGPLVTLQSSNCRWNMQTEVAEKIVLGEILVIMWVTYYMAVPACEVALYLVILLVLVLQFG